VTDVDKGKEMAHKTESPTNVNTIEEEGKRGQLWYVGALGVVVDFKHYTKDLRGYRGTGRTKIIKLWRVEQVDQQRNTR